jgi:chlorobactene glucosyltransferase
MSPDLVLLIIILYWSANTMLFLLATGKVYFSRKEIPHLTPAEPAQNGEEHPLLSIIIPARNEEHNIANCLDGLVNANYPADRLQIIVVNDRSTDRTATIVEEYSARNPQIELLEGQPLPEGWTGKVHGCWQGAEQARGEWLMFLDADSTIKPDLPYSAVSFAAQQKIELLTLIPFQLMKSMQERFWLPGIFFGFSSFLNLKRINNPDDPYAIANGQFLLFRKDAYDRIDGHRSIQNELNDDLAIARLAKQNGLHFHCSFAEQLLETRMYHSLNEIWNGFSRNASDITQIRSFGRLLVNLQHTLTIAVGFLLLPILAVVSHINGPTLYTTISLGMALCIAALLLIAFITVASALRIPLLYGFSIPLGLLMQGALSMQSYRLTHNGVRQWKGRSYSS